MKYLYPLKLVFWNLNTPCYGFWRWAFELWLSHESGALLQGIIALVKETPESFLPLPPWEESEETAVYKADTKSAGALILNFSASRTMKKKKKKKFVVQATQSMAFF